MANKEALQLLRAHGRCTGAMIFAMFGGCWLLLSCAYFSVFHIPESVTICIAAALLVLVAVRTRRGRAELVLDSTLKRQKEREDRQFVVLNIVTYGAVFSLFLVLPRLGLANYVFPSFVALIGLHFFPMPSLYSYRANFVVGAFMVLWAVFCTIRFRSNGNTMAAWVALGAGIALWCSSMWASSTAERLFSYPG